MIQQIHNIWYAWNYYTLSREKYKECMGRMFAQNLNSVFQFNSVIAAMSICFIYYPLLIKEDLTRAAVHIITAVIAGTMAVYARHKYKRHNQGKIVKDSLIYTLIVLCYINTMAFGMYISVWGTPENLAVTVMICFVCALFLFVTPPLFNLTLTISAMTVFIISAVLVKDSNYAGSDITNALTAVAVGSVLTWYIARHKIRAELYAGKLNNALEDAKQANEYKSTFIAEMSHEIRSPMNAVIGMVTIGKSAADTNRKNDCFEKIENASQHLLGVINDILDISKIEAGKLELSEIEFNFGKMVQKILSITQIRVDENKQRLFVNADERIPEFIIGDDQRLSQIILNLLSNAVKFTPAEGEIRLDVSLVEEKDGLCELRFEVADSGIGISPEQQEKLFSAFTQAESGISRKFGGTGLGLKISKNIIELMGGRIWIESELGKGAHFIFTIKVHKGKDRNAADSQEYTNTVCLKNEFADKFLLLAEDIEINREIIITLLEETGINIECAENGKEAFDMVEATPDKYDLIFMDMQMPEMNGLESTRHIRELPMLNRPKGRLPIIAMTANVFKSDIDECIAAGMDGHLGKPLVMENILEVMRKYL